MSRVDITVVNFLKGANTNIRINCQSEMNEALKAVKITYVTVPEKGSLSRKN